MIIRRPQVVPPDETPLIAGAGQPPNPFPDAGAASLLLPHAAPAGATFAFQSKFSFPVPDDEGADEVV